MFEGEEMATLVLGLSAHTTFDRLESQKYSLIKREALIILLIAFGEFLALSYIIIHPVSVISKSLDEQKHKDGVIIGSIPITSNDEFGALAGRFNKLSDSLNTVNHELKSRIDYADKQLRQTNRVLRKQSEELRKLSITDALTDLFNRRYFEESLADGIKKLKQHGGKSSLIMIDIDHFKSINDTYGHTVGDLVIKEVARASRCQLSEPDVLCRIGGEEFAVLARKTDKESALKLAEEILRAIRRLVIPVDGGEVSVTVSLGVMTISEENISADADDFYKHSDAALYHSKNNGRNRVTHFDDVKV